MAQGVNVSCTYLQDENGQAVSAQRAKSIRSLMLSSFRELHGQGLAPESIGQASLQVLRWLFRTLRQQYFELRLCADNWKAIKLLTDNYSQWYNYHVVKKTRRSTSVKPEDTTPQIHESPIEIPDVLTASSSNPLKRAVSPDVEVQPTKKQRTASMTSGLPDSLSPLSINSVSEIPCIESRDQGNEVMKQPDSPCGSDVPQHMPLCSTDKGKAKETANIEIKNPLDHVLLKPRPRPIPKVTPAPSTNAQTNSPAPSNDSIPTPSLTVTPTNSDSDAASLSVKRELLVAAPAKKTRQPSVKPMRIGTKVTPRNLCALDWQAKGHQRDPASAFALYWNNLAASIKEEYKRMAAAQIGSSSTLQGRDSENEHHD